MDYKLLDFIVHGDERGKLVALESLKSLPFNIKRIYYIYDTIPEIRRGAHAHREIEQVAVVLNGSCKFSLEPGGGDRHIVELNRPEQGLYMNKMVWGEMFDFSYGCVLMVLASGLYDEKEYIRNYGEFLKLANNRKGISGD